MRVPVRVGVATQREGDSARAIIARIRCTEMWGASVRLGDNHRSML
jgi:hypothetical protein